MRIHRAFPCGHVNIRTNDLEASIAFYRDALGLRLGERPDFGFPGAWLYDEDKPAVHLNEAVEAPPTAATPSIMWRSPRTISMPCWPVSIRLGCTPMLCGLLQTGVCASALRKTRTASRSRSLARRIRTQSSATRLEAMSASFATVFMLRAVPSLAAGMRSLERPIVSPYWT